jgi:hypothetical protein
MELLNGPSPVPGMLQRRRSNNPIREVAQEWEVVNNAASRRSTSSRCLVCISGQLNVGIVVAS